LRTRGRRPAKTLLRDLDRVQCVCIRHPGNGTDNGGVPPNIIIIALPPKSPELNPVENVWQFKRIARVSIRLGLEKRPRALAVHSAVTDFTMLRGWSMAVPPLIG
jgi:hypothetical protein